MTPVINEVWALYLLANCLSLISCLIHLQEDILSSPMGHDIRDVSRSIGIYTINQTQRSDSLQLSLSHTLTHTLEHILSFLFEASSFSPSLLFYFSLHLFPLRYHSKSSNIWFERQWASIGYFASPFLKIEYGETHMKSHRHSLLIKPITIHWSAYQIRPQPRCLHLVTLLDFNSSIDVVCGNERDYHVARVFKQNPLRSAWQTKKSH